MLQYLCLEAFEPAPVAQSLTPPLQAFPPSLRDVLTHLPPRRLSPSDIRLQHILLIHSITFSPSEPILPTVQPVNTPKFLDHVTGPVSALVGDSISTAATNRELGNGVHPLALNLVNRKIELEYTIHPLLALINEDRAHHHRMKTPGRPAHLGDQQLPLVVSYLFAMAQRWFTAVDGDEEVRVWAITTRVDQTAEVFWADVKREDMAGLCLRVRRSGRWDDLGMVQERRDAFRRLVRGIWKCVWQRATPEEILHRWGMPRECGKRKREEECRSSVGKRRRIERSSSIINQ